MSVFFLSLFPARLAACVSACAVGPARLLITHMTSPNFLLALHSGSFRALRIPSPGFLSSFLLSLPSFARAFLPSAAVEPAVKKRGKKNKKENKLLTFRLCRNHGWSGSEVFTTVLRDGSSSSSSSAPLPPHPPPLFPFETRVLYHQLHQAASQCDQSNKTAILL